MANPNPQPEIFDYVDSRTLPLTQGILVGAIIAIVLLVLVFFYMSWRSKRRPKSVKALNPWQELRKQLDFSKEEGLERRMAVLRRSLSQGLELASKKPFTSYTTSEIVRELPKSGQFSSDFQAQCVEFLRTSDRVVFAKADLDQGQRNHYEQQVALWLERLELGQPL